MHTVLHLNLFTCVGMQNYIDKFFITFLVCRQFSLPMLDLSISILFLGYRSVPEFAIMERYYYISFSVVISK